MPKPSSAMEVFKHLEKSNCRECGEKTCLAFAAAVFQSRKGLDPIGEYVSFRELEETAGFSHAFFSKRCEMPMKRIADSYPGLFEDLVHIFGGQEVDPQFASDIAVVLYPFPKVPVMVCYWGSEDGLESTLNLFFDKTADHNLPGRGVFTTCVGLAQMIERLSVRHAAFVGA